MVSKKWEASMGPEYLCCLNNLLVKPKNEDHVSHLCLRKKENLEFSQSQSLGKSSEFFQVPEPTWRRQLEQ